MYTRRLVISSLLGLLGSAAAPSWADAASRKSVPLPGRKPTPSAPKMPPRPPAVVILDPGHGGRDPGAIGVTGTEE
ncbi:MAG: hypothetical protein VW600_13460 [Ferrovibrio sp.]